MRVLEMSEDQQRGMFLTWKLGIESWFYKQATKVWSFLWVFTYTPKPMSPTEIITVSRSDHPEKFLSFECVPCTQQHAHRRAYVTVSTQNFPWIISCCCHNAKSFSLHDQLRSCDCSHRDTRAQDGRRRGLSSSQANFHYSFNGLVDTLLALWNIIWETSFVLIIRKKMY